MAKNTNNDFSFTIVKHLGVITTNTSGWTKELNLVSWNGKAAKYDIRDWDENHEKMSRGITLTEDEMNTIVALVGAQAQSWVSSPMSSGD